jgi:hypothetical protein
MTLFLDIFGSNVKIGVSLGTILAVLCSWERNKSIIWAVVHAFFGWIYVIYYAITRIF